MKVRFDSDLFFWIVVMAVSVPICGVFAYLFVSGEIDFFRHRSSYSGSLVELWHVNRLALLVCLVIIAITHWLRRRRNRNKSNGGGSN